MLGRKVTPKSAWNNKTPSGRCPACGAEGIEVKGASTKRFVGYGCSDANCFTKYPSAPPYYGNIYHTHWHELRRSDGNADTGSTENAKGPRT
jgi:ssDNA-binding Zn-finger/Zn-ribbon topoisomerase 1